MKLDRTPEWKIAVGGRLGQARAALGKNQAEISRVMGVSYQAWNNYESGRRPLDIVLASQLCERFGLTLDWLYRGELAGLPFEIAEEIIGHKRGTTALKN